VFYLGLVKRRALLILLVAFLFTWEGFVPNAVRERVFMTKTEDGELEPSAGSRVSLWEEALQVANQNAVLGVGFNTYRYGHHYGGLGDTHNYFVKALVETGSVGLCIFLWLLWKMYRISYRLFRIAGDDLFSGLGLGVSAWLVTTVVANMFGDRWTYMQITGYLLVLFAFVVRGQLLIEEEEHDAEDGTVESLADESGAVQPA
jgi:O-antigen ligase